MTRATALFPLLLAAVLALAAPGRAAALELALPGRAELTGQSREDHVTHALAVGPWQGGQVQSIEVSGQRIRQAWKIIGLGQTTAQLAAALAEQLAAAGYEVLYQCEESQCGGFDFRYATLGLPEPEMHVDLGNYRYIAARRLLPEGQGAEYASLMISRSQRAGYVELTQVLPQGADAAVAVSGQPDATPAIVQGPPLPAIAGDDIATWLESQGRAVLAGLDFAPGSANLGPGPFPSLSRLADYLSAHPEVRVTLVGHTDAVGALESNIALSKRRAEAVRRRLIEEYGVAPSQLDARGVGYLAPIASNQTAEGRALNRRVEAVVTSTP